MSYIRVIPRDLFNEADLLKCLGRLWILLDETRGHDATVGDASGEHDGTAFDIVQDESDGSIYVANVPFRIGRSEYTLFRPLNARSPWPLYIHHNFNDIRVFDEDGKLSGQFQALIMGLAK